MIDIMKQSVEQDAGYYMCCEGRSKPVAYLLATVYTVKWAVGAAVCAWRGHAWVDDSVATPDSGNMDMRCTRCGESFHHQLY
jgi:hypothetical protein